MSINAVEVIDGMGISRVDGKVVLTISDHLQWDSQAHFSLIEQKISAYLTFAKNGQLFEELPDARGRDVRIELIHQHAPDSLAEKFLAALKEQIEVYGVEFFAKNLPEGY